jgi:hypothetical protein
MHPVARVSNNTLIKTTVRNKHVLRTVVLIKVLLYNDVFCNIRTLCYEGWLHTSLKASAYLAVTHEAFWDVRPCILTYSLALWINTLHFRSWSFYRGNGSSAVPQNVHQHLHSCRQSHPRRWQTAVVAVTSSIISRINAGGMSRSFQLHEVRYIYIYIYI